MIKLKLFYTSWGQAGICDCGDRVVIYWETSLMTAWFSIHILNNIYIHMFFIFTQGQFWPSGIVVAYVCVCVFVCLFVIVSTTSLSI